MSCCLSAGCSELADRSATGAGWSGDSREIISFAGESFGWIGRPLEFCCPCCGALRCCSKSCCTGLSSRNKSARALNKLEITLVGSASGQKSLL